MADQPTELRQVNWSECFSFTHLFRSFRLAVGPTKLTLAFVGLALLALWGGIMDGIWRASSSRPFKGEVNAFWQVSGIDTWRREERNLQAERLRGIYAAMTAGLSAEDSTKLMERGQGVVKGFADDPAGALARARAELEKQHADAIEAVKDRNLDDDQARREKAAVAGRFNDLERELDALGPKGVFASFLSYETGVMRQMIEAAGVLNFTGHVDVATSSRGRAADEGFMPTVRTGPQGPGVLACGMLMLRGVQWLCFEHWFYAILLGLGALGIWALFGGAICRLAALNVARDEQISMKAALCFASRKWLGFLCAPLLPIGLIAVIGVFLVLGGVFMSIPYLGDVIGGLGFGLALIGGFVMALVAVGALAAVWLMWPTIAVEGSDAFDAMSRSYSYVYSRPWRALFYGAVALVYGSLCYIFARFFVLVLLKLTRLFVGFGMGIFSGYRPGTGVHGATKIDALWPHPSFERLVPDRAAFGFAGGGDAAASFFIWVWTLIVAVVLCAFLVSFFLSASTVAYYLLRRKVDATDIEDVYVEEDEQDEITAADDEDAGSSPAGSQADIAAAMPDEPTSPAPPAMGPSSDTDDRGDSDDASSQDRES